MENGKISIIMPTYNTGKYIEKAIDSIMNQTYNNIELIIIDASSQDNTKEICMKYVSEFSNIIWIEKENTGVSDSRNVGIERATGEYIYFMDSDDYIENNMFEDFIQIMKQHQPDLITSGFFSEVYISDDEKSMDKIYTKERLYKGKSEMKEDFIEMWDKHIYYNIWNKLYLKSIIEKYHIRFENYPLGEDVKFNQDYLMHANIIYNTSYCYYHYVRERSGSMTKKYNPNLFQIRVKENNEYIAFFEKYGIEEKEYIEFVARRYIERTLGCIENLFNRECNISAKEKYNHTKEIIKHEETRKYLKIIQPNSRKISIMLIPYRLHLYAIAMIMGKVLAIVKEKYPRTFNSLKNRR